MANGTVVSRFAERDREAAPLARAVAFAFAIRRANSPGCRAIPRDSLEAHQENNESFSSSPKIAVLAVKNTIAICACAGRRIELPCSPLFTRPTCNCNRARDTHSFVADDKDYACTLTRGRPFSSANQSCPLCILIYTDDSQRFSELQTVVCEKRGSRGAATLAAESLEQLARWHIESALAVLINIGILAAECVPHLPDISNTIKFFWTTNKLLWPKTSTIPVLLMWQKKMWN